MRRSSIPQVVAGGTTSESVRKCYRYLTTCTHTGWCQQGCRKYVANVTAICKEIFCHRNLTIQTHPGWVTEDKRQMQKCEQILEHRIRNLNLDVRLSDYLIENIEHLELGSMEIFLKLSSVESVKGECWNYVRVALSHLRMIQIFCYSDAFPVDWTSSSWRV